MSSRDAEGDYLHLVDLSHMSQQPPLSEVTSYSVESGQSYNFIYSSQTGLLHFFSLGKGARNDAKSTSTSKSYGLQVYSIEYISPDIEISGYQSSSTKNSQVFSSWNMYSFQK